MSERIKENRKAIEYIASSYIRSVKRMRLRNTDPTVELDPYVYGEDKRLVDGIDCAIRKCKSENQQAIRLGYFTEYPMQTMQNNDSAISDFLHNI